MFEIEESSGLTLAGERLVVRVVPMPSIRIAIHHVRMIRCVRSWQGEELSCKYNVTDVVASITQTNRQSPQ